MDILGESVTLMISLMMWALVSHVDQSWYEQAVPPPHYTSASLQEVYGIQAR